jgi:aldose sugar dehydrogenase
VVACSHAPTGQGAGEVGSTAEGKPQFRVETVVAGLEVPWSIAFTPDDRIFITERPGRVRVVENGKLQIEPLAKIADVEPTGESGLMGLTLHPGFAQNHLLYVAYAYRSDGKRDRVVRYRETGAELVDRKVIIEDIPAAQFHAGCRLRFAGQSLREPKGRTAGDLVVWPSQSSGHRLAAGPRSIV